VVGEVEMVESVEVVVLPYNEVVGYGTAGML
jgi:hypothetical protein